MYTAFYGLREKPFSLTPDPRFLFLAESHREALAHVLYGIDQGEGFISITGEVGTGKTTLCRTLLQRLGQETEVAYVFNPTLSGVELMRAICAELGLSCEGQTHSELTGQLNSFLLETNRAGRRVLLIIDEAQNLSAETLEEIRLFSNLETPTSKLIQILLFGQPELDEKLDSRELRQLRQRISVRWSLAALSARETREYVTHRLTIAAGYESRIFTADALREVHRQSRGIPRLINVLCDRSLLSGFAQGSREVTAHHVRGVAREIRAAGRPRRQRWIPALVLCAVGLALAAVAWQLRGPMNAGATIPSVAAGPMESRDPIPSSSALFQSEGEIASLDDAEVPASTDAGGVSR